MEKTENYLGLIKLGKLARVSDPCYDDIDDMMVATTVPTKAGEYSCYAYTTDCGDWGVRVSSLKIVHTDLGVVDCDEPLTLCAVDSGQLGIFDYDYFRQNCRDNDYDNKRSWYRRICDLTEGEGGTIDDMGVATPSGYGDGMYDVYVHYVNDESEDVDAIEIIFIEDEYDEDEYDDDDE